MSFSGFMRILYIMCYRMTDASLQGKYVPQQYLHPIDLVSCTPAMASSRSFDTICRQMTSAFSILEKDFEILDRDGDKFIEYTDLSATYSDLIHEDRHSSISQLHKAFTQVDADRSNTLNFREYLVFAFTLVQEGAYKEVVRVATDSCQVKKLLIDLLSLYRYVGCMFPSTFPMIQYVYELCCTLCKDCCMASVYSGTLLHDLGLQWNIVA